MGKLVNAHMLGHNRFQALNFHLAERQVLRPLCGSAGACSIVADKVGSSIWAHLSVPRFNDIVIQTCQEQQAAQLAIGIHGLVKMFCPLVAEAAQFHNRQLEHWIGRTGFMKVPKQDLKQPFQLR